MKFVKGICLLATSPHGSGRRAMAMSSCKPWTSEGNPGYWSLPLPTRTARLLRDGSEMRQSISSAMVIPIHSGFWPSSYRFIRQGRGTEGWLKA